MSVAIDEGESGIIEIPRGTKYWFVRTDGGQHFNAFYDNGFIGIEWNYITLNLLRSEFESRAKEMIAEREKFDSQTSKGKAKISSAYNKIIRFAKIEKGDIVVIPSERSNELAFGIVEDDGVYWSDVITNKCSYTKRRKVTWLLKKELQNLDPKFFEIRITRHAISDITKYADYIDRATLTFFKKNEAATLVLDILQEEDIELVPLVGLIEGIEELLHLINAELELNENLDGNVIKLNLQSKGLVAVVSKGVKTLAVLGLVWALESCGSVDKEKAEEAGVSEQEIIQLRDKIRPKLRKFDGSMDTLHADKDKLAKTFSEK